MTRKAVFRQCHRKDGKLYLIYTGHNVVEGQVRQVQCLAVSEDGIHLKICRKSNHRRRSLSFCCNDRRFPRSQSVSAKEDYFTVVATKTADARGQIVMFHSKDLLTWEFIPYCWRELQNKALYGNAQTCLN